MTLPVLEVLEELQRDPAAHWIIAAVEDYHAAHIQTRDQTGWFHASQLGQDDMTLVDQYRGLYVADYPPITQRVFDLGTSRDKDWKRYLADCGLSRAADNKARQCELPNLRLRGTCDDIVVNPETGVMHVFEFKTIAPFAFGMLRAPKPEHLLQVHVYMAALGLSDSIVLYENKANQALLAFYQPFDLMVWTPLVLRVKRLRRWAEEGWKANPSPEAKRKAMALS